jgi:hypothetical protein
MEVDAGDLNSCCLECISRLHSDGCQGDWSRCLGWRPLHDLSHRLRSPLKQGWPLTCRSVLNPYFQHHLPLGRPNPGVPARKRQPRYIAIGQAHGLERARDEVENHFRSVAIERIQREPRPVHPAMASASNGRHGDFVRGDAEFPPQRRVAPVDCMSPAASGIEQDLAEGMADRKGGNEPVDHVAQVGGRPSVCCRAAAGGKDDLQNLAGRAC